MKYKEQLDYLQPNI